MREYFSNTGNFHMKESSIVIIGAGLVGLASAYRLLLANPKLKVTVCEKEWQAASHQSGGNSGVIHSGVYYKPGSLKAKNCLKGREDLLRFCEEKNVAVRQIHKVIVAQTPGEEAYLRQLLSRAQSHGVPNARLVDAAELKGIEPDVLATAALYLPECHIVDYPSVAKALCREIERLGAELVFEEEIRDYKLGVLIGAKRTYQPNLVINCAGLYSDRIARLFVNEIDHQILPFRGEYYLVRREKQDLVKGLIYPVPDPQFPFLGVHLTPMLGGKVEAGPNAILAFAREGYRKWDIRLKDAKEILTYPGFWKMAGKYWKAGAYEMARSLSKRLFVRDVQRLMPALGEQDLVPGGAGIRAQVVLKDGTLMDDFAIKECESSIHVLNAPSPAATSCLSIGQTIAQKALSKLGNG